MAHNLCLSYRNRTNGRVRYWCVFEWERTDFDTYIHIGTMKFPSLCKWEKQFFAREAILGTMVSNEASVLKLYRYCWRPPFVRFDIVIDRRKCSPSLVISWSRYTFLIRVVLLLTSPRALGGARGRPRLYFCFFLHFLWQTFLPSFPSYWERGVVPEIRVWGVRRLACCSLKIAIGSCTRLPTFLCSTNTGCWYWATLWKEHQTDTFIWRYAELLWSDGHYYSRLRCQGNELCWTCGVLS